MLSRLILCLITAAVTPIALWSAARQPTQHPIRHVDHIMIRADDPREVVSFFTQTLQLPAAWPLETRGGVTSGGVGFGNVNVEAIRFPGQRPSRTSALLVGFAFEPSPLRESLAELQRRGMGYGAPRPFMSTGVDGIKQTLFTNVTLRDLSDTDLPVDAMVHIFISEYSPAYVDVEARRVRLRKELSANNGGPLGVDSVREIVVGTADIEATRARWQTLLDPRRPNATGTWQIGDGPSVRIVAAKENRVQELVVRVSALPRAKTFLRTNGLLGSESEVDATLDASKTFGVNIRVVAN